MVGGTSWWQHGIIYHIYPRSFQDTDGDGIGDLRGIEERLEHIAGLGCDAFWISPIYPSPMRDHGYDVADYTGVHPLFGTLEDFDRVVAKAKSLGLKVILDFVPNHTSDQHPWFLESRASRESEKRDWYVWRDAKPDGSPPNNWISVFSGSAWEWDEATGQYYLHSFLTEQPDLNWRNPEVRAAMYDAMRFWLDRGVDGFRVDVVYYCMKDPELRDNPPNPGWKPGMPEIDTLLQTHSNDHEDMAIVIAEMRGVIDEYDDRLLIGEIYLPLERLMAYYGRDLSGAHLPFNFQLILTPWTAREVRALVEQYEGLLPEGGWPNWVLGNHDQTRVAARVGEAQARIAAMLLFTLRGTPTLYYGDEIGMPNVEIPPGRGEDAWGRHEAGFTRDPQRTPMQWDASRYAGFSTVEPWLPLSPDHAVRNVELQDRDPGSMLTLHRRLIALRRASPALAIGDWSGIATEGDVFAFKRRHGGDELTIVLNFGTAEEAVPDLGLAGGVGRISLSTHLDREDERVGPGVVLRPNEGVIIVA
jgi:alpha-glucosidase